MSEIGKNPPARKAIALHYDGKGAPRVTAKGQGYVAEDILALARRHNIPLHEDAALAGLLARVELGEQIPEKLYRAVAEVIAFTWRLNGKRPNA
jgi:flagellar biosynthesis protein